MKIPLIYFTITFLSLSNSYANLYDITKFGAIGDAKTINTKAIQKAIDECHAKGGGKVFFPAGVFVTGTLVLKSHVTIYLSENSVLMGSPNIEDYPDTPIPVFSRIEHIIGSTQKQLLFSLNAENIAIDGYGVFHANGEAFQDHIDESPNRPYGIRFVNCKYVTVSNIHMRNSAYWMQRYLHCDYVRITGVKVWNHCNLNNDGIDIDGCKDVVISDCIVDSSDDGICLKSEGSRMCENVTVNNCIASSFATALKLGTGSLGGFRNIAFSNCIVKPSKAKIMSHTTGSWGGLAGIDILEVDGAITESVSFNNILIDSSDCPIFIKLGNRNAKTHKQDTSIKKSEMSKISLSNIIVRNAGPISSAITGYPGNYIKNVSLSNIQVYTRGEGTDRDTSLLIPEYANNYPVSGMFGSNLPAYGFYFRHVDGIYMHNIFMHTPQGEQRPPLVFDDAQNVFLNYVYANVPQESTCSAPVRLKNMSLSDINLQNVYINGMDVSKYKPQKTVSSKLPKKAKLPALDSALVVRLNFEANDWLNYYQNKNVSVLKDNGFMCGSFSGNSFLIAQDTTIKYTAGDVSFSVWMKLTNPASKKYYRVFSNRTKWDEPSGFELEISPANHRLNFSGSNTDIKSQGLAQVGYDNQWHHYTGVINAGRMRLYVDGKLAAWDDSVAPALKALNHFVIGADASMQNGFEGLLAQLKIWNRALDVEEVKIIFKNKIKQK